MRLNDDAYVLTLPFVLDGRSFPLNLTVITDAANGTTLVDTGLPGQRDAIAGGLAEAGLRLEDLSRIVLTHHDIDHVGSLHDLEQASGARVLAHEVEAPFIDGSAQPRYASPEVLERRPEMRAVVEGIQPTPVDELLRDGTRLDVAGWVRVIFTPGHTAGYICLYLERSRTLVTGDALTASEGRLQGPNPSATPDMQTAASSVRKLAALDVAAIVCYHGGVVDDDANGQLAAVAEQLGP